MAEWLVGPVMEKIINTCFEYLQNQFTWQTGIKKELERLREIHPKITAIISAASRTEIIGQNSALNKWIWQLRDAIDEADDLLDEFEYLKHRNKEDTKVRSYWNNMSDAAKRLCVGNEDPLESKPDLKRLEEVVHKLDRISAEVTTFLHLLENIKQEQREQQVELHKTRETGSLPKNDLVGRGENMEFVIRWLRQSSDVTTTALYRDISLLSIVGHGGMGKTTLMQHVYQDEIRKEFDLKIWVCVSDNFDVKKVITDMLECLQNKRPFLETLDALQENLRSEVMSKKFLLVLDDLWDKEEEAILLGKWGDVLAPLAFGGSGSKILITTRSDSAASMIAKVIRKKKEALRLEGLKQDECLEVLTTHAFAVGENPDDHENLNSIARELVKKLYGSPLAAKVIGGVLNSSLDEGHWRNVLNSSLGLNDIFPILKLSYIFLPEYLQTCFSFCSIFAQDYIFYKDDLVRMWIAVGFIQPSNQGETLTLEDIGERYFDVLIKKSFFDKVSAAGYKMHDLLRELAQSVSAQECFRFVGDEKLLLGIPETIRHLSVETNNPEVFKKMGRFKNLRTLLVTCYDKSFVDALDEMFKVTRSIRLLHINDARLLKVLLIPENIRYLHHLRYLRFPVFYVKQLPRSLTNLYHLQFIISEKDWQNWFSNYDYYHLHFMISGEEWLNYDSNNNYFPRDMNNLCNLRYLCYPRLNFPGIGNLKFLQQLDGFCIKNEKDYRIEELEHMNELRILGINNLRNVRDAQEACNAKLCDKRKLMILFLNWNHAERDIADPDLDERVLDTLQPHSYLKTLYIINYMGSRSAIWMNEAHLIKNLKEIELSECLEWQILPPFGQLPFLKTLKLWKIPKVKLLENKFRGNDLCCVDFPSLDTLYFTDLESLVDWFDASIDGLFPCLTKLNISHCPNLQELPYLPPKLESLEIIDMRWRTFNCCSISQSIPLKVLNVLRCQNITSISLADNINRLIRLTFENLPSLQSLPSSLTNISSLEILELKMLPRLRELPDLPPSLKNLTLKNLSSLQSLPSSLTNISSLEVLEFEMLPQVRELPDLPPSLKNPKINKCGPELMRRLLHQ